MMEIGVLPKELIEQLEKAPKDPKAVYREKLPMIDEAIKRFFPATSANEIGKILGVSGSTISKRAKELKSKGLI